MASSERGAAGKRKKQLARREKRPRAVERAWSNAEVTVDDFVDGRGEDTRLSRWVRKVSSTFPTEPRPSYRLNPIRAKNCCGSPRRMPEGSTAKIALRKSRSNAAARSPRSLRLQNDIE